MEVRGERRCEGEAEREGTLPGQARRGRLPGRWSPQDAARERGMSAGGHRVDGERDRNIAAAYVSGLSILACTVKFGTGRGGVRGALARTGTPVRRAGRPGRPSPWAAEAAARHLAGERVGALAREHGVHNDVMRHAIEQQGVTVTVGPRGRPRGGAR
jgi:hypothetical protein